MPRTRKSPPKGPIVFLLHVSLEGIDPLIWRRIWVDGGFTLHALHHILQAAMGWTDAHLHDFHIEGTRYCLPDPEEDVLWGSPSVDERTVRLDQLLKQGMEFHYQYDFGDSWDHRVLVEKAKTVDRPSGAGYVESGENACPPEDSGGIPGYQEFLDNLRESLRSTEVKKFLRWAGKDFDATRFDRFAANAALLRMAWNHWVPLDEED